MKIEEEISIIVEQYEYKINNSINRNEIAYRISVLLKYNVKDISSDECIDNGYMTFEGMDPKTKKIKTITVGYEAEQD